ncbi:Glycosyltransferase 2-like domain-containing protein [Plasmodiophora brassicae]
MLTSRPRRSHGTEAKTPIGKAIARSSLAARVVVLASLFVIMVLFGVLVGKVRHATLDDRIEFAPGEHLQSRPFWEPGVEFHDDALAAELRGILEQFQARQQALQEADASDDDHVVVEEEHVEGNEHKLPRAFVVSSDMHMYTNDDMPYFDESVADFRTRARHLLAVGRKRTMFVSIGSFRDDLCPATLAELFAKAEHPENVYVGLVDQVKLDGDSDDVACDSTIDDRFRKQIRLVRLHSMEGAGPTHARYIASKLWQGEEFYFQIDSHSHFLQNWDTVLMDMIDRLPDPSRSIITHYPPGDEAEFNDPNPPWNCVTRRLRDAPAGLFIQESDWCFEENRTPGIAVGDDGKPTTCVSPFMGAGMIVGRSQWIVDVPFDKYLPYLFHGEELLLASRLWTSGWDMFTPSRNIIDHKYGGREKNVFAETNEWAMVSEQSAARARYILKNPLPGDDDMEFDPSEIAELGLGSSRSYEAYLEFGAIDLKDGNSTGRCGQWYDWQTKEWKGKAKVLPISNE